MRKVLFSLLLASTMATPALAQDWSGHRDRSGGGDQARSERSESRQDRSAARSESREDRSDARQAAAEARQARAEAQQARAQAQQERVQVRQQYIRDRGDHVAQGADADRFREMAREVQARRDRQPNVNVRGRPTLGDRDSRDTRDGVVNLRGQRGNDARDSNWRDQRGDRDSSNWRDRRNGGIRIPVGARPDRPAPAPETAYSRDHRTPNWDRNWRNDHSRHDWRRYRDHHRSTFHLGVYFDPFGWGYQRHNIGWRLWPNYYSSNYWLNDPSMYALPYAPFPYKWVRYYDDAILVNTYTGQVVDVMYDFFW